MRNPKNRPPFWPALAVNKTLLEGQRTCCERYLLHMVNTSDILPNTPRYLKVPLIFFNAILWVTTCSVFFFLFYLIYIYIPILLVGGVAKYLSFTDFRIVIDHSWCCCSQLFKECGWFGHKCRIIFWFDRSWCIHYHSHGCGICCGLQGATRGLDCCTYSALISFF